MTLVSDKEKEGVVLANEEDIKQIDEYVLKILGIIDGKLCSPRNWVAALDHIVAVTFKSQGLTYSEYKHHLRLCKTFYKDFWKT